MLDVKKSVRTNIQRTGREDILKNVQKKKEKKNKLADLTIINLGTSCMIQ